jgi:PTH1 family peptidyl-tRNA hydrolase
MKLIVGLGNPGKEYENTRHNVGFMFVDNCVRDLNLSFSREKFGGLYAETIINGEKVIFLKPQKYINLSGEVIYDYINFFKIDINDI